MSDLILWIENGAVKIKHCEALITVSAIKTEVRLLASVVGISRVFNYDLKAKEWWKMEDFTYLMPCSIEEVPHEIQLAALLAGG